MCKYVGFLFVLVSSFCQASAQIFPKEGSILNYRLVGFSFPAITHAKNYSIEVAAGNYTIEDSFKKNVILNTATGKSKIIAEVPAFGKEYTWRIVYTTNGSGGKSGLHHFSTGFVPAVDTNANRLKIITHDKQHKDYYVFVDAVGVLYDMEGRAVWYLPKIDEDVHSAIRDLKLSPMGTITLLKGSKIYEVSYDGNILWQKPGNDTTGGKNKIDEIYHHEFTRCANGNYMVLGYENVLCKSPTPGDSSFRIISGTGPNMGNNGMYTKMQFGMLKEYDENGALVWTWSISKYYENSDLVNSNIMNGNGDLHDNSFYFDEHSKTVYLSFKNINRIIKIKYPEGNILNTYGDVFTKGTRYPPGAIKNKDAMFCGQHACKYSQKGYLYMLNNGCNTNLPTKAIMMKEPLTRDGNLEKIWEYQCFIDDTAAQSDFRPNSGGGNIIELPDQSIFVDMGNVYGKRFIVNMKNDVLWSAISQAFSQVEHKWKMVYSYRSSVISSRKDLEQLIWNSEKYSGRQPL